MVECPSIYEMMANPYFKWKKQPEIRVWRKKTEKDNDETSAELETFGLVESIDLFNDALKNNEVHTWAFVSYFFFSLVWDVILTFYYVL